MITKNRFWTRDRRTALACLVLALGAGALSLVAVTSRTLGSTVTASTIRGESVEWVASGPYAYNAVRVVAEGVGWDWATLVLAVPCLTAAAWFTARGSLRGRLAAAGLAAYLLYQYLQYAVVWALGPFFPAYILLFSGALWTLAALMTGLSRDLETRPWPDRYPRRSLASLFLLLSLVLLVLWIPLVFRALTGPVQGILLGQTTLVVQALDLGLVVPLAVWAAFGTLARRPSALLFGPVLVGKAVFMASAIEAMLVSAWAVEGQPSTVPMVIFGAAALASLVLGLRALRSL